MKDKNAVYITGKIVNHDLKEMEFSNGNAGITGKLTIQVTEDGANITIRCFASPTYSSGKTNFTYNFLQNVLEKEVKTIDDVGVEDADFISVSGKFATNYYIGRDGCTDPDDVAKSFYIEGRFFNMAKKHEYSIRWNMNILITSIREKEENPENGTPRSVLVKGYYIDAYNKRLAECDFEAFKEAAINYYLGIAEMATEQVPYFAEIWGGVTQFVTKSILKNNFGDDEVREYKRTKIAIEGMGDQIEFASDSVSLSIETFTEFKNGLVELKEDLFKKFAQEKTDEDLSF